MSQADISRMLERYAKAVGDKDLEAFTSLYDAEVRVFDTWGRWDYDGIDAWRSMARGWFESLSGERVAVTSESMRIAIDGDLATADGIVTYTAMTQAGEPIRSMRNRLTWIVRRVDGAWKVVHEHTSVPLDFETKAMLADGGRPV